MMISSCTCNNKTEIIKLDGSSTVFLLSEAVAEEYRKHKNIKISIGVSGTGGGFKKLCTKRIDIIGASRAIAPLEMELCKKNNIKYIELKVAYDGIVVAVNKNNYWIDNISVQELKKIFEPKAQETIKKWSDVNNSWPNKDMLIFTPGFSSGTYDYFTKVIVGHEHESRSDITSSEDDNMLVHGVRENLYALGFFSFAYYLENKDRIKALGIAGVWPTIESIRQGEYVPLSRPVYIYASQYAIENGQREFLRFYLESSLKLAKELGFVALNKADYNESLRALNE